MAKFITTAELYFQLEKLIKEADKKIVLISPYLKIHKRLRLLLEEKMKDLKTLVWICCRENDLPIDEREWFLKHENIKVYFQENLHAKCYLNEKQALITSMNLHSYSITNNIEYGFLVEKDKDEVNYTLILDECARTIIQGSKKLKKENASFQKTFSFNELAKTIHNAKDNDWKNIDLSQFGL